MDKKELRKQFRLLRKENCSLDKSKIITAKLLNSEEYKNASSVFVYVSYNTEVDTLGIITQALKDKKKVAVPVMTDVAHTMVFIEIRELDSLEKNSYGILEPKLLQENIVLPDDKTIVIVPALAFDKRGYRLGYGGGYYDKYLSEHKTMCNIGIGFSCQLVDKLIVEENDIKLDKLITEE